MPIDTATADATGSAAVALGWRAFVGRGLKNQVVCLAVALLIWLFDRASHGSFPRVWLYSASIGTACWFFIDGSRIVLSRLLERWRGGVESVAARSRWPGALWMLPCIVLGTLVGYSFGVAFADALTGYHTPSLLDNSTALIICLLAAVGATFYFYANERLHLERAAAEAARRLAAESQLRLLQSQLEPHMLFNTLANLRVLIALDPPRAQAMLDRLIAFLRATLGASRSDLHPLSAEFDRLADYLALMAVRMGPRLAVELDLPAALRGLPVPPLLLQPLVENAIRHGLEPRIDGGRVTVRARVEAGSLVLEVQDDGAGLPDPPSADAVATGYGTDHVRERLAALYGPRASFEIAPADGGGTLARVCLPLSLPRDPQPVAAPPLQQPAAAADPVPPLPR